MAENPENKTIVVVDDDPNILAFFFHLLMKEGFKVVPFSNSQEAVKKLASKAYHVDLILLDLMMPGRGGYDILKELQDTPYKDVPVFVVTARVMDEETIQMIRDEPNVREFFPKPVDYEEFKRKVHVALRTMPRGGAQNPFE